MLEIKRKPNSPVGRSTSAPVSGLTEAGSASQNDHYPTAHTANQGVSAVPAPSMVSRKLPPLIESLATISGPPNKTPGDHRRGPGKGSLNL